MKIIRVGHEEQGSLELRLKIPCPLRAQTVPILCPRISIAISDFRILTTALRAFHGECQEPTKATNEFDMTLDTEREAGPQVIFRDHWSVAEILVTSNVFFAV